MYNTFIKPLQIVVLAAVVALSGSRFASAEDAASHYQTAAGMSAYIGVVPAKIVKGHPPGHPERSMHGGPPVKSNTYHLIVAGFRCQQWCSDHRCEGVGDDLWPRQSCCTASST